MLATDDEQTLNNEAPPTRGCSVQMLLVVMMTVAVVVGLFGRLLDDRGLSGARCTTETAASMSDTEQPAPHPIGCVGVHWLR